MRYPIKDQIAIVGLGCTGYARDLGKTANALAIDACLAAMDDAGIGPADINGICATTWNKCPPASYMQAALGIPTVTWHADHMVPVSLGFGLAMDAVFAGAAETALVYHSLYRLPSLSGSAAKDPLRVRADRGLANPPAVSPSRVSPTGLGLGYAGMMARYLHTFSRTREDFGYFALNARANAADNELAALRTPLSMDEYMSARMVDDPMSVLDMDMPVDGADAFIVTTVERARDMKRPVVAVHAAASGRIPRFADGDLSVHGTGHEVVVDALSARSDIPLTATDLFMCYDGFSIIAMTWLENVGYCGRGEGGDFLRKHWDKKAGRILIGGKVPINTHGGSLAEGGTQGAGHLREAVVQLRGDAGDRQVPGPTSSLVTIGAFLTNPTALVLRKI